MNQLIVFSVIAITLTGLVLIPSYQPALAKGFAGSQWYAGQRSIYGQHTTTTTTTTTTTATPTPTSSTGGCILGKYDKECFDPVTQCTFTKYEKSCNETYFTPGQGVKGFGSSFGRHSAHITTLRSDTTPTIELIAEGVGFKRCVDSYFGIICLIR